MKNNCKPKRWGIKLIPYYKNKIRNIFKTEKVRVIIIARQITEYLKMGTMDMIDYELFEYKLNIELDKIK